MYSCFINNRYHMCLDSNIFSFSAVITSVVAWGSSSLIHDTLLRPTEETSAGLAPSHFIRRPSVTLILHAGQGQ